MLTTKHESHVICSRYAWHALCCKRESKHYRIKSTFLYSWTVQLIRCFLIGLKKTMQIVYFLSNNCAVFYYHKRAPFLISDSSFYYGIKSTITMQIVDFLSNNCIVFYYCKRVPFLILGSSFYYRIKSTITMQIVISLSKNCTVLCSHMWPNKGHVQFASFQLGFELSMHILKHFSMIMITIIAIPALQLD